MEAMNDPALVEALLERVPGAARSFIARHDAFLRKTVLSASRAAAPLIDDLTHDVYVHLWGNDVRVLRKWQREHPLRGYLRTVVTRLVWDRLGRLQPAWELVDADPFSVAGAAPEPCDLAPTPEEEVAANEMAHIVRDALGQPGQVGVIYRIAGVLAGLDLFGSERTFARAFPKVVRGSALQAFAGSPHAATCLSVIGRFGSDFGWAARLQAVHAAGEPPAPDRLQTRELAPVDSGLLVVSREKALPWLARAYLRLKASSASRNAVQTLLLDAAATPHTRSPGRFQTPSEPLKLAVFGSPKPWQSNAPIHWSSVPIETVPPTPKVHRARLLDSLSSPIALMRLDSWPRS